ncbi:hypothetical protein KC345_g4504 [Hortaea werneckii]|nr:hypothetical protein KC345_g4504 [Hortaea werneckii]
MEKLILRSIMYGADKIPDSWFDKVPGGFYKAKDSTQKKASGKEAEKHGARPRTSSGSSGANGSARNSERSRRYSTGDPVRGAVPLDGYEGDDGYRSEGARRQRRKERVSSSYDRADGDSYSGDDRRSSRREHDRMRRRRSVSHEDRRGDYHGHAHPVQSEYVAPQRPPAADGPASARSTFSPVPPPSSSASFNTAPPGLSRPTPGYVPYADIYGPPTNTAQAQHQQFAPPSGPPQSSNGSRYATPPSWTAKMGSHFSPASMSPQTQSSMYTVDPRHPLTGQLRADQAVGVGPGKGVPVNRRKGDSHRHRHRSQGPNSIWICRFGLWHPERMRHDCGERSGCNGPIAYCFECAFDGGFTPN